MNSIREIQRLNKLELEQGISPSASWHTDYRDTAYVYVGGLSFDLTEGDIITIFSQFGEPTFVKLARDKTTGKSRGFAWVKYEDQRSCDLAVDNLGGATVLGRLLRVDHTRYKKRDDEPDEETEYNLTTATLVSSKRNLEKDQSPPRPRRPLLKEEIELEKLIAEHDDEDPMKEYLIREKKKEVQEAVERHDNDSNSRDNRDDRSERSHHHRHRDRRSDLTASEKRHRREPYDQDSDAERDRKHSRRTSRRSPNYDKSYSRDYHNRHRHRHRDDRGHTSQSPRRRRGDSTDRTRPRSRSPRR